MAVLHVAPSLDERMGGSVRAPLNICKYLREAGAEAHLAATTAPGDDLDYLEREYAGVPHHLFPRVRPQHNFRSPELAAWLRRNVGGYELVEIHGVFTFPVLYAAWACARAGVPYVLRPHGQLEPYDLRKHAAAKRLVGRTVVRALLDRSQRVLLTTATEEQRLEAFGSAVRRAVVSLPVQRPVEAGDGPALRRKYGLSPDAVVVLFLGRYDHKKGLQFLLPAMAALRASHPELALLVVGGGDERATAEVDGLVAQYDADDWTVRTGFLSGAEKQSAFAASDVFALPSLNENFGIVVVEAMYAGLALLLSTEVYVGDVPAQSGAAVLCSPTVASCTDALATLLADRSGLPARGRAGRAQAESHFTPEAATADLMDVYADVLGRPAFLREERS